MPVVTDYTALLSGDSWTGLEQTSAPAIVTFSFATTAPATDQAVLGAGPFGTFGALSDAQKAQVRTAMAEWADASGITIVEGAAGNSDITFSSYDFTGAPYDGRDGVGFYPFGDWNYWSYPHFFDGGFDVAGHVLLNRDSLSGGLFNYGLLLHEIGHALGFKHPTESFMNYASGVNHNQVLASDNGLDTIMTQQPNGPQHLTALDIAAAQHVYGTNAQDGTQYAAWSYNSGSNSFSFTALNSGGFTRGSAVNDLVTGSANADQIVGLTGNDTLNGLGGNDSLFGGTGTDRIDGGLGSDSMYGGKGYDTYYVDNAGDQVVEFGGEGTDTVVASVSFTLGDNVERLKLTGTAALNATGNGASNNLTGNDGSNRLDGGLGNDTMTGGAGNDIYIVERAGDIVVELAGGGNDKVMTAVSYTLPDEVEALTMTGAGNIAAAGNGLGNTLTGNSGDNRLTGNGGADRFVFKANSGVDRILDFSAAQNDLIDINAYSHGVTGGGGVTLTTVGSDTRIDLGSGNTITVVGVASNDPGLTSHIVW